MMIRPHESIAKGKKYNMFLENMVDVFDQNIELMKAIYVENKKYNEKKKFTHDDKTKSIAN